MLRTADETMSASSPWDSRGVLLSITRAPAGAVVGHHKVHGVNFHAPRITSCRGIDQLLASIPGLRVQVTVHTPPEAGRSALQTCRACRRALWSSNRMAGVNRSDDELLPAAVCVRSCGTSSVGFAASNPSDR